MNYILVKKDKIKIDEIILKTKFKPYINSLLLEQLTTIDGRLESIKEKYKYYKLTPLFINEHICLIPIKSINSIDNIYINVKEINYLKEVNKKTLVIFKDSSSIIINKSIETLKENIKRANSISINIKTF